SGLAQRGRANRRRDGLERGGRLRDATSGATRRRSRRKAVRALHDRAELGAQSRELLRLEHFPHEIVEARILNAAAEELPSIGIGHSRMQAIDRRRREVGIADAEEVADIGGRLEYEHRIHALEQLDQVADGALAARRAELLVLAQPLELVQQNMARFLLPMEE